jgi:hypothetical protein
LRTATFEATNVDSSGITFIDFDLRFHTEAHRAKDKVQLRRLDSDTIWFVAPAKEQLALIADNWLHGISFC